MRRDKEPFCILRNERGCISGLCTTVNTGQYTKCTGTYSVPNVYQMYQSTIAMQCIAGLPQPLHPPGPLQPIRRYIASVPPEWMQNWYILKTWILKNIDILCRMSPLKELQPQDRRLIGCYLPCRWWALEDNRGIVTHPSVADLSWGCTLGCHVTSYI